MFLRLEITHAMLLKAVRRSVQVGKLNRSFTEGDRNLVGFLGEELYQQKVPDAKLQDTFDYDFLLRKQRIDVKARLLSTAPKAHYEMGVPFVRPTQNVDFYVFCGISQCFTEGWIFGFLSKQEFLAKQIFKPKGSPRSDGKQYISDYYAIQLNQLRSISIQ